MTIEEMAEKEFPIKSWEERRAGHECRKLYCIGAMAVLNELESYIGNNDDLAVNFIKDKIKELKAEYL